MARIRLGIIGINWPGRMHTEAFSRVPGVEIVAVSDLDPKRRAEYRSRYGLPNGSPIEEYGDYRDMLKNGELDAVVIALPTAMHYRATLDCLKSGCHVLCEKPPTTTAREMGRICRAVSESGLTYMFARQSRFRPVVQASRKLVAQGRLGTPYYAEAKWIRCRGVPWGRGFTDRDKGGGVLLDLGVHVIDAAWFIMGNPEPVEAFASQHVAFKHHAPKDTIYTADDLTTGMIRFETGASISFTVSFALNTAGAVTPTTEDPVAPGWQDLRVYGEKAGLDVTAGKIVSGNRRSVVARQVRLPVQKSIAPGPRPVEFVGQAKEFVRAARAGVSPVSSAEQALKLMKMLEALKNSAERGKSVSIR